MFRTVHTMFGSFLIVSFNQPIVLGSIHVLLLSGTPFLFVHSSVPLGSFDCGEVMNNTIVYIGMPVYVTCAFRNPSTYLKIELLGHSLPPAPAVEESHHFTPHNNT